MRDETKEERDNRNWNELLQELRVSQTGVQLLTGLLLTLPFQDRFTSLDDTARTIYLGTVSAAVVSTGLLIAPVSLHRLLFRQGEKDWLVQRANHLAMSGLVMLAIAIMGVVWLIFDIVVGRIEGFTASGVAAGMFVLLWWAAPWWRRKEGSR